MSRPWKDSPRSIFTIACNEDRAHGAGSGPALLFAVVERSRASAAISQSHQAKRDRHGVNGATMVRHTCLTAMAYIDFGVLLAGTCRSGVLFNNVSRSLSVDGNVMSNTLSNEHAT